MKGWGRDRTVQYRTWYGKNEKGINVVSDRKYSEDSVPIVSIHSATTISLRAIRIESLCETGAAEGNTESEGVFCPVISIVLVNWR